MDMPKPRFVSSTSQSANDFFLRFLLKKKSFRKGHQSKGSKVTLLLRWPEPICVRVGYVFESCFQRKDLTDFYDFSHT